MRFEVPQFIEVEDKIVGPLTWKQFIYLAGGIGILIIVYVTLPFILFAFIGIPLGALAGFLAFHRINNRPFSIFLEAFVSYMRKGKLYLWQKQEQQTIMGQTEAPAANLESTLTSERTHLASLAEKLEYYSRERER
jgi:hypothetical protein